MKIHQKGTSGCVAVVSLELSIDIDELENNSYMKKIVYTFKPR